MQTDEHKKFNKHFRSDNMTYNTGRRKVLYRLQVYGTNRAGICTGLWTDYLYCRI